MFFEKIHPIFFPLTAILLSLTFYGKIADLFRLCWEEVRSLVYFLFAVSSVSLLTILVKGTAGMAYMFDTHITAALLGLIVYGCSSEQKKLLNDTLLFFIFFNSLVAIGEFITGGFLMGYEQQESMTTFRSSAFFGHPLNNSIITGSALFFLFATEWEKRTKLVVALAYAISLLCYGGRIATLICIVSILLFFLIRFIRRVRERPQFLEISLFIFGVPLLLLGGFIMVTHYGIGTRIFQRELFDQSGLARLQLFSLLPYIPLDKLMAGLPMEEIEWLSLTILDLPTIENFWVLFILQLGIPSALVIGSFLLWALFQLSLSQKLAAKTGAFAFLLIASSNNSLAAKTACLTIIILLLVTNLPPEPEEGTED